IGVKIFHTYITEPTEASIILVPSKESKEISEAEISILPEIQNAISPEIKLSQKF
ncbi:9593_t:CDS:1, partial [Diversispora eburnea]